MDTVERTTAVESITDAEAARDELQAALAGVGITLPSLGLDGPSLAADAPRPLVELGRCAPDVARRLAAALRCTGRER
ncbi:hypothetical protein OEIGOIKO_04265 [Streptomyces chrestomyceticus JCM 4735]|uniref:Uncharacterized protein n=1 Tax=Streptomyces chrestomyceticus JCM 4735 TaxID=1306181 RepID=A0A7U9PXL9_9ACTN|nr:hypothetical protein [Streptomyces chrestomyceticus]GCD36502.1 hypothetical protein OEIGOIKO_04265 [Streptomyces chrestomyceticus JCM 4735]